MRIKIKKIIAREGLIIISILSLSGLSLALNGIQAKGFEGGYRKIPYSKVKKYDLFILGEASQKPEERLQKGDLKFDPRTAILVDSPVTNDEYASFAKETLLNRRGFRCGFKSIIRIDRYEEIAGWEKEKKDVYYRERERVIKAMESWTEEELANMAGISLAHFNKAIQRMSYQKMRLPFEDIGIFLLLLGYPIYLLFRFILWAIRILKEREE